MAEADKPENWTLAQINARLPIDASTYITKKLRGAASLAVVRRVLSGEGLSNREADKQALVVEAARKIAASDTQRRKVAALRCAVWSLSDAEVIAFFEQNPLPAEAVEMAQREAALMTSMKTRKRAATATLRDVLWHMSEAEVIAFFERHPLPASIKIW